MESAPVLRSQLLARGYTDDEVRRLGRRLVSVRPGAYVVPDDERLGAPESRHLLAVRATVSQVATGSVVGHVSAAVLHGIAVWDVPLDRVHVTRPGNSGGRCSRHLQLHVAPLPPEEIVVVDGIAVTSIARTVADLARTVPFEQAVVIADNALFRDRSDDRTRFGPIDLAAAPARAPRRHGAAAAWRVSAFANGLAESEFDGRVKYGRLLRPGQSPGDAVFAEKVREDALREPDRKVARWTWGELDPFDPVDRRLRRALGMP